MSKLLIGILLLLAQVSYSQVTSYKMVKFNDYGADNKNMVPQKNRSTTSISNKGTMGRSTRQPYLSISGILSGQNGFMYGYSTRSSSKSKIGAIMYDKAGKISYNSIKVNDKYTWNVSSAVSLDKDNTEIVLAGDNAWIHKSRKVDAYYEPTIGLTYTERNLHVHTFDAEPGFRCIESFSVSSTMVAGLWGSQKSKKLSLIFWDLSSNTIKEHVISNSYGGKAKIKQIRYNYVILFDTFSAEGKCNGSYFKEVDYKTTLSSGTLTLLADYRIKDIDPLQLQDMIVDSRNKMVVGLYHASEKGKGSIWLVQISEDRKEIKIGSTKYLDLNLWCYKDRKAKPVNTSGNLYFEANPGKYNESKFLLAQRAMGSKSYLVLLRPDSKEVMTYDGRKYYANNPTILTIDNNTLLPYGWDFYNATNNDHSTCHSTSFNYLSNLAFKDFTCTSMYNFDKDTEYENIEFHEVPKSVGYDCGNSYSYLIRPHTGFMPRPEVKLIIGTDISKGVAVDKVYPESGGLRRVLIGSKVGFVDAKGIIVIPFDYTGGFDYTEGSGIIGVRQNGKQGYVNLKNQVVIPLVHDRVFEINDGMIRVKKGSKFGFYNTKGELIYNIEFDEAEDFKDGKAVVVKDGKSMTISKTGSSKQKEETKAVINLQKIGSDISSLDLQYSNALSDGLRKVVLDGKTGYVDAAHKIVIPFEYAAGYDFKGGYGVVGVLKNGKQGYINKKNEVVIPIEFDKIFEISEGLIGVIKGDKQGFFDTKGNKVFDVIYDFATDFSGGVSFVEKDGKDGYIAYPKTSNKDIILTTEDIVWDRKDSEKDGYHRVQKGKYWGIIDSKNNIIIPIMYSACHSYNAKYQMVGVKHGSKQGYVNREGLMIIRIEYNGVYEIHDGIIRVLKGGRYGFFNTKGEVITECIFSKAEDFKDRKAYVEKGDRTGYINTKGEVNWD